MYPQLLRRLQDLNRKHPVKLGLECSQELYRLLNTPLAQRRVPIIHVGGTNGKGTVCLKLAEWARRSGIKTGLFVSPHIASYRERIQIDGQYITEDSVSELLPQILSLCEKHNLPATFFEITTMLALLAFERASCRLVVLEVGLGGR